MTHPLQLAIGASDACISAALRARELDPSVDVTVVVRDSLSDLLDLRHPVLNAQVRSGGQSGASLSGMPRMSTSTGRWSVVMSRSRFPSTRRMSAASPGSRRPVT